jgi:hypothetical protein
VLVRHLPRDSALVTAMNDGQPVWSAVEHLLADLWALLVRAHSEKDSVPDDFDHPTRAAMTAKAKAAAKTALKALYLKRKRERTQGR